MSNPTPEEILHVLRTAEGMTTEYVDYVAPEGSLKRERVSYGEYPVLRSEVPDDAPEYVLQDSLRPEDLDVAVYVISEELYENTFLGLTPRVIEREGGEGEGELAHVVIKVGEFYFRADFTYASWDGYYYDDAEFRQVHPKEVVVTVYE